MVSRALSPAVACRFLRPAHTPSAYRQVPRVSIADPVTLGGAEHRVLGHLGVRHTRRLCYIHAQCAVGIAQTRSRSSHFSQKSMLLSKSKRKLWLTNYPPSHTITITRSLGPTDCFQHIGSRTSNNPSFSQFSHFYQPSKFLTISLHTSIIPSGFQSATLLLILKTSTNPAHFAQFVSILRELSMCSVVTRLPVFHTPAHHVHSTHPTHAYQPFHSYQPFILLPIVHTLMEMYPQSWLCRLVMRCPDESLQSTTR